MKVRASVKKMCRNCKIIRRKRVIRVICTDARHNRVDFNLVRIGFRRRISYNGRLCAAR